MSLLPPPPRKLKISRFLKKLASAAFNVALGLLILGGMSAYCAWTILNLYSDRALFAHGIPAAFGTVDGTKRSRKFFFNDYKLDLHYEDAHGEQHTAHQEFDTVLGSIDETREPEIRYDPANPDRAVSSWSVEVSVSRGLWSLVSLLAALIGFRMSKLAIAAFRDALLERSAAREGREMRVELKEKSRDGRGNITYTTTFEPTPGEIVTGTATLNAQTPFWIGDGVALGLYAERHRRVFIVGANGEPLALDAEALANAREHASAMAPSWKG
jgi:hypothetical protein